MLRWAPLLFFASAALAADVPTLWVIGDSTANNADGRGWADHLGSYFDGGKMRVVNRARAGRSSRTFLTEGLWDRVRDELKPGDYVFIQFGHNDGGPPDRDRARGSLPGIGDEAKEFTMPDGHREMVHSFGWYVRQYITEARAKGAKPVVLSLTVRNIWTGGQVERGSGQFGKWSAEVAQRAGVPFLDVTSAIVDRYEQMGEERVKALFPQDHTHTSPEGAQLNAEMVVAVIKCRPGSPLNAYLSAKGDAVAARKRAVPALVLIGDSTVRNGSGDGGNGQWGWGEPLAAKVDASRMVVINRAVGGLSSRTFYTLGHWATAVEMLQRGDVVLMQFGHNDNAPLDDKDRSRGSLPGVGEETREIENPMTHQHETVHTYGWYLRQFIAGARAKGAAPLVCSLVPRKTWKDGKIVRARGSYGSWAAEVAAGEHVPLIDLNELVARRYDQLGPEKVDTLFADPHTHTSRAGAELNADVVMEGLRALKLYPTE